MTQRAKFWTYLLGGLAILLAVAVFAGMRYSAVVLKSKVQEALGPNSQVSEIVVHWRSVEVVGVTLRAPGSWPTKDSLRAERIVIVPDFMALFTRRARIKSISIEGAYLSIWRLRDGKMRVVPNLTERPPEASAPGSPAPSVDIGEIVLKDGAIEFFDGTVTPPNHMIRMEHMDATVGPIQFPGLAGRTNLHLASKIKGAQAEAKSDGTFALDGWMELATRNSEITTTLNKVDLIPFQPYLLKAADTSVKSGTLDLQAKATVKANRLFVPGSVTLNQLELGEGEGALGTFMGLPRAAVIGAMKNTQGLIAVPFIIAGDLNDPQFSFNAGFAKQVGQSVAAAMGLSIEGLVKGATEPASRVGSALKNLLKPR